MSATIRTGRTGIHYESLHAVLRVVRMARGISQEDLAVAAKLNRTSIVNFEAGRQDIPMEKLQKIAGALGYDLLINLKDKK